MTYLPVNAQQRDISLLDKDVARAIYFAEVYLDQLRKAMPKIDGVKVLELGPGINFGAQLILASYGAQVTVADLYLAPWDDSYHPELYRKLASRWPGETAALDLVLKANGYHPDAITLIAEPAENLASVRDGTFDCVLFLKFCIAMM